MKFSLILNTRNRVPLLVQMLNSAFSNAKNPSEIEILIRADEDDKETREFYNNQIKTLEDNIPMNVLMLVGKRPKNLHESINYMAKYSIGEYIFVLNDDVVFLTTDWDVIAYDKLESFKTPDGILYGKTSDSSVDKPKNAGYSSFPILSRSAFNTLGFVMHEDFVGLGGDSAIYKVYKEINRVVDLSEIKLDHVLHNEIQKIFLPDETAYHMRLNSAKNHVDPLTIDISKDVEKLNLEISKFQKIKN